MEGAIPSFDASIPDADDQAAGEPQPSAGDACGCAPVRPAQPLARKVKIVLRVEPVENGLRALVAVGADDCDPELRVVDAPDLAGVLQLVPTLLTTAETRWANQARYPMAARPRTPRTQSSPAPRPSPPPVAAHVTAASAAAPATAQEQLQLFG